MSAVLPGKPQSRLQGLATGCWDNRHLSAYITGSAFTILESQNIIQSVYDDDQQLLEAIAVDESSGKVSTCTATQVRVYKPVGLNDDALKWAQESSFDIVKPNSASPAALSWGSAEELLVGSSSLCLYSTKDDSRCLWEKVLPTPVKAASLSYDSSYIASIASYDRLPKIWHRITYGPEEVRFDLSYLAHPDVVTTVRWRRPLYADQAAENILYTFCLDAKVRIWTPTDSVDGKHWQLWGQVDFGSELQYDSNHLSPPIVFIIDGRDFIASVEKAVETRMTNDFRTDDVALDHLVAVANRSPEVCVAIGSRGGLSAWAMENVSSRSAESPTIFTVAQVASDQLASLQEFLPFWESNSSHVEIQTFCDKADGKLHILLHSFDGRIGNFTTSIADLLDPTDNDCRLSLQSTWTGHSSAVRKMNRNFSGHAVVSQTVEGETVLWRHTQRKRPNLGLDRGSIIPASGKILRICVLRKGRFVILLASDAVSLWDCRFDKALLLSTCQYQASGTPLCLIILPRPNVQDYTTAHVAMITSQRQGVAWEVNLPPYAEKNTCAQHGVVEEFCKFELGTDEHLVNVLPVDAAGSRPAESGFLDVFARDVAISYTQTGRIDFWTARVNLDKRCVDWLSTCSTETGLAHLALISGSTLKKAALVDSSRSQLTIWDIGGCRLEFGEDYETRDVIQDLDWTSTPDSQSILAVGFQFRVIMLSQMRFDYLNKGPAWAPIREISIRELTPHPIGDSTWLGDGYLVIGAGNQMFVHNRNVSHAESLMPDLRLPFRKDATWDLFNAVQRFNGPLPVFHPQFLSQCILSGKSMLVKRILVAFHKILKYIVADEVVDDYLGMDLEEFYMDMDKPLERGKVPYLDNGSSQEDDEDAFNEEVAAFINEKLTEMNISQLSGHEQIQLADIIECAAHVERHRRSMDENGARFMLFYRQHALHKRRANEVPISWREITWAYHSNSQDMLVDFVSRQSHGGMLWEHARESGIFMWLTDIEALRTQFEVIARNEYTKTDDKNPVDCSIFYMALGKKTVLQGLWRMASGNREQAATQRLLANDFVKPEWKRVAMKNAYALLSKRRFEYAAAFFLLAGKLEDAAEVCLRQLKDMQLAVAITRVYEGDNGPVLRKLLQETVLPVAAQEGNRWLASWAFWKLGRKDMAVRALITPVYALVETPYSPDMKSRLFLADDPALVVLYSQLRQQTLQTLRGAAKVTPKVEWEFVLHSAKLYDRMGCDLLGLDLVRNWEFQQSIAPGLGGEVNPLKLLRRRSSLVVDDRPLLKQGVHPPIGGENRSRGGVNAPPTTFEEPDAASLLDSFGF